MTHKYRQFLKDKKPSIVEIFRGYRPPSSASGSPSRLDGADVVVDGTALGGRNLQLIPSRFDFADNLVDSLKPDPRLLARFLSDNFADRDLILIDCAPTESIFTMAAYAASRYVLVPVKPEYFATIGFPLLQQSMSGYKSKNLGHELDVIGVVVNNAFYHGGNNGGPEKANALEEIRKEASKNKWHVFKKEIPHSRGFPKMMRGNFSHLGKSERYQHFAEEFFSRLGLKLKSIGNNP
jgi:chromosome partitioning protein